MQGPASPIALPRFSASMLPIDADPAERDFVRLLERALAPSFTLVRRLGAGGMGSVYLARDPVLKRLVAVKVMAPSLAADAEARARFEREAQAVAAISHPNVVAVYSVGELENGVPFLVMQYVEGRAMADRVAEGGPLDAPTARRVLGEVASALAAAHRKGIIHRDIKPANILWDDETGRALVTDFGIAAVKQRGEQPLNEKLTQTGMSLGTPAYMSPEQVLAEPVTEKTDVYALGLLGYELLTGDGPYQVTSPRELMAAHLRDKPRKLSTVRADVDAELERLLEACLDKDPAKRPNSAEVEGRLTHGASILLEWPPPGLEQLPNKLKSATNLLAIGSTLVGVPLVLLSAFDRESYVRQILPAMEFMLSVASLGVLLFIGGCFRFVKLMQSAGRAVDTGYRWGTVAEAAADSRGDTGAVITGAREYATLAPRQRSNLRRNRALAALLLLAATFVPMLGFALGVLVFARSVQGPTFAFWSSLGLALLFVSIALSLMWYEDRLLRAARGRRLALGSVHERPTELAAAWTESFDQVREGQSLGPGPAGRKRGVLRVAFGVAAAALLTAFVGNFLVLATTLLGVATQTAAPRFANTREKILRVQRLSRYIVPADPSITSLGAGQALHSIARAGGVPPSNRWEAEPALSIPAHTAPQGKPPFGADSSIIEAIRQAPRGFSDQQRNWLARAADNPALAPFRAAASARHVDLGAAVWSIPPASDVSYWELPIVKFGPIRAAALSNTAQAALDLASGERVDAERRLREVLSVGFLLIHDGNTLLENLTGAAIVTGARLSLEAFYNTVGRPADARFVSAATDPTYDFRPESDSRARLPVEEVQRILRRTVLDTSEIKGLRWEFLLGGMSLAPCTDMRQILFGADSLHRAMITDARRTMVHSASDSILFSFVEQSVEDRHILRNGVPIIHANGGLVGRAWTLLTGRPVFESCVSLFF